MSRSTAKSLSASRLRVMMLALLASPWKKAPSIATSSPGQQIESACQQHELAIGQLERGPVVLAEIPDRTVAGPKPAQQPHHLHIAARLALKPARGPHLIEVAI